MQSPDVKILQAQAETDDLLITYGLVPATSIPTISEAEDEADEPLKPTIDTHPREFEEREVLYESGRRREGDVVLSGPLIGGWGPGRYFQNRRRAREWCVAKYGAARVWGVEKLQRGRWAYLIKGLKK